MVTETNIPMPRHMPSVCSESSPCRYAHKTNAFVPSKGSCLYMVTLTTVTEPVPLVLPGVTIIACRASSLGHQNDHLSRVMCAVMSTRLITGKRHSHVPFMVRAPQYSNIRIYKYANTQICKYSNMQISEYTNI